MLVDDYLENLQEKAKRTTITRVTRDTKIKKAIGQLAVQLAKQQDDPLYKKMSKYKKKWKKYKEMIQKKYGPRVRVKARQ
jgi:ribosomal protein S17